MDELEKKPLSERVDELVEKAAGFLFIQYKKGGSKRFGSRWLDLYGRIFLGPPELFGLDETPAEHRKTFYQLREDRWVPPQSERNRREQYMYDNILMHSVRDLGRKYVALTFGFRAMILVALIAAAGTLLHRGRDGVGAEETSSETASSSDGSEMWSRTRCVKALVPFFQGGKRMTPEIENAAEHCKGHEDFSDIMDEAEALSKQ